MGIYAMPTRQVSLPTGLASSVPSNSMTKITSLLIRRLSVIRKLTLQTKINLFLLLQDFALNWRLSRLCETFDLFYGTFTVILLDAPDCAIT